MPRHAASNGTQAKKKPKVLVLQLGILAMQLLQFLAAWLFPGAVCVAVEMASATTDDSSASDIDRASSSSSSPALSAKAAGSRSSISSPSSSSSSSDGHPGSFTSWHQQSASTTPLCFGAGAGRRLLLRGYRARAPAKQQQQEEKEEEAAATMAPKAKGDVVGRYLRKISRRLRKARTGGKGKGSSPSPVAAVDDTARERAASVARAVSYCKGTLRRGTSPPPPPLPPPPSPSLDDWLRDRQEEIIASAAAHCDERRRDSRPRPPRRPCRAAGAWPVGVLTMAKQLEEPPSRDGSVTASAVAHGEESPRHGREFHGEPVAAAAADTEDPSSPSDLATAELEMLSSSSLDEMGFLKIFGGDEEMVDHLFISVEI